MNDLQLKKMQEIASDKFDLHKFPTDFIGEFIFNSLSFETRKITLEDVNNVISNNQTNIEDNYKLHIVNYKNAFDHLLKLLNEKQSLNEDNLKDLHEILMNEVNVGGLYRNVDISIKNSNHTPPAHLKVYDRMKKYFLTLDEIDDVIEKAAYSLVQLDKIHPFLDGNGRLARLVLNYVLLENNYLPIIIPHIEKNNYFKYIEEFKVNKNINPFKDFITELLVKSL